MELAEVVKRAVAILESGNSIWPGSTIHKSLLNALLPQHDTDDTNGTDALRAEGPDAGSGGIEAD